MILAKRPRSDTVLMTVNPGLSGGMKERFADIIIKPRTFLILFLCRWGTQYASVAHYQCQHSMFNANETSKQILKSPLLVPLWSVSQNSEPERLCPARPQSADAGARVSLLPCGETFSDKIQNICLQFVLNVFRLCFTKNIWIFDTYFNLKFENILMRNVALQERRGPGRD